MLLMILVVSGSFGAIIGADLAERGEHPSVALDKLDVDNHYVNSTGDIERARINELEGPIHEATKPFRFIDSHLPSTPDLDQSVQRLGVTVANLMLTLAFDTAKAGVSIGYHASQYIPSNIVAYGAQGTVYSSMIGFVGLQTLRLKRIY